MLIYMKITHADGDSYTFVDDAGDLTPLVAPPTQLDIKVEERTVTSRDRMQQHGKYPAFAYHGGMTLDITGDLFKDTSADYITERKAVLSAIYGPPDTAPSIRDPLHLEVQWAGDTQKSYCDCILMDRSMPIQGLYPDYTQYMISLYSFKPWLTLADDSGMYYF